MSLQAATRGALLRASLVTASLALSPAAFAAGSVVISQVYGGGGNAGAPLTHDFVELFNRGDAAVSLSGLSIQYTSAAATGLLGASSTLLTELPAVSLQPGQYYLVQEAFGGTAGGAPLPSPDLVDATAINMAGAGGKVALVTGTTGLGCNGGSTACSAAQLARIVDLVGSGTANFYEGSGPTAATSNATAARRAGGGCTDTDNNAADFTVGAPAPRNSGSPLNACSAPVNAPIVTSCPASVAIAETFGGVGGLSARDADGVVGTASIVSSPVSGISLVSVVPGQTLSARLEVASFVASGSYPVRVRFGNEDATPQTATCDITVNVAPPLRIREIQGAAHLSPYNGQAVANVPGVVTALRGNGFYLQDPEPDSNPATSEGIFVFTNRAPTVSVGDALLLGGSVAEYRAGSGGSTNLTLTEITSPSITVLAGGQALPAPVVLGAGGRAVPGLIIEDDSTFDVEAAGVTFDPASDGLDFFESLEGMRVRVNAAVAVGPSSEFGEIVVVGDGGASAGPRTARGGVVLDGTDFNPERIILDDVLLATGSMPVVNVGDGLGDVVSVVDYSFGNYKVYPTSAPTRTDNGLAAETTTLLPGERLRVATFNIENFTPATAPSRVAALAAQVVNGLRAPDIVALQEIQDNNGAKNDAVVDASQTWGVLVSAIQAAGGPAYQFADIAPVDDQDGGEPGGNIRVGFLYNPARVKFVARPGGNAVTATTIVAGPTGPALSYSPGRIAPLSPAFAASRKPLAAEFRFNGRTLFVINNHFNSKGGDDPLFGRNQPPVRSSELQRTQQAAIVRDFVQQILAADAAARVIVLGDLNDFQFSDTLQVLKSAGLTNLVETLPLAERYSYVFEGNSQVLDNLLVSATLANEGSPQVDIVHANAEFADNATDHDPTIAALLVPRPYEFVGFFSPVDNAPTLNVVRAGQALPLKWRLLNRSGAPVRDLSTVEGLGSRQVSCDAGATPDAIEQTNAAGASTLRYDLSAEQFVYNWKTAAAWRGTCRELQLKLSNDQTRSAVFRFN